MFQGHAPNSDNNNNNNNSSNSNSNSNNNNNSNSNNNNNNIQQQLQQQQQSSPVWCSARVARASEEVSALGDDLRLVDGWRLAVRFVLRNDEEMTATDSYAPCTKSGRVSVIRLAMELSHLLWHSSDMFGWQRSSLVQKLNLYIYWSWKSPNNFAEIPWHEPLNGTFTRCQL